MRGVKTMCRNGFTLLCDDSEELLHITDKDKKIFIRTYEPHGYISIDEAKKLIEALETIVKRIEGEK
jgi:hypothetical protein